MSALEIVLVSVLGALVIVVGLYLFLLKTNVINRQQLFHVINEKAIPHGIVFFGDSLTDFFPIQDFFPGHTIYNRGIAGDKTTDLLKRIDNVIAIKPRKIILQIGTNDLGKRIKPEKIITNINLIIDKLQAGIPGVEIIVVSLYPISHHRIWLSPIIAGLRSNKCIREVNRGLVALCAKRHLTYLDLHAKLVGPKGRIHRDYTLEGLHISGIGYGVIAEAIRPYIN